jgi:hypothetical protein
MALVSSGILSHFLFLLPPASLGITMMITLPRPFALNPVEMAAFRGRRLNSSRGCRRLQAT